MKLINVYVTMASTCPVEALNLTDISSLHKKQVLNMIEDKEEILYIETSSWIFFCSKGHCSLVEFGFKKTSTCTENNLLFA